MQSYRDEWQVYYDHHLLYYFMQYCGGMFCDGHDINHYHYF
jgi:hypothetical protein